MLVFLLTNQNVTSSVPTVRVGMYREVSTVLDTSANASTRTDNNLLYFSLLAPIFSR